MAIFHSYVGSPEGIFKQHSEFGCALKHAAYQTCAGGFFRSRVFYTQKLATL